MSEFKTEHNVQTNEITEIPLTETELNEIAKLQQEGMKIQLELEAAATQKAIDKAALLAQLGITEEQAALLLS